MDSSVETVRLFTNCTQKEAEDALLKFNGNVYRATDSLMKAPEVSGAKHIPKPREIDRGMTSEQEEICAKGRELMDKLTVVASAAHSKIRSGQSLAGDAVQQASPAQPSSAPEPAQTAQAPQ